MSRFNHNPSTEYVELSQRVREFEREHTLDKAERAVADGLADKQKEAFKSHYGLDKTSSGTTCITRLLTGGNCPHSGCRHPPADPPHKPPHSDHANLWLSDGEPAAFTMHLYDLDDEYLRDIMAFADSYGLEVRIEPRSWYFPNHTVHVVFLPSGKEEPP